jgi:hypothetical protein
MSTRLGGRESKWDGTNSLQAVAALSVQKFTWHVHKEPNYVEDSKPQFDVQPEKLAKFVQDNG